MTEYSNSKAPFWTFNAGNLIGAVCVVFSLIYGASAFATKTGVDANNATAIADALKIRADAVDLKTQAMDSRLIVVETSIPYIRESLARIERAVSPGQTMQPIQPAHK